jgi:membrane protein
MLARLRDEVRALTLKEAAREIIRAYGRNDLLTFANAIAFKVLFALVPLTLFGLGLLAGLGLENAWSKNIAPDVKDSMSPAAFQVVDETVRKVVQSQRTFWMTIGAVIAVWSMSGGVRAVMDVFDRIYEVDHKRSTKDRYLISFALAIALGLLLLGAVAAVKLTPLVIDGPLALLRWPVAVALLFAAVALQIRFAPSERQPTGWVTFGSALAVLAWIVTSLGFAAYLSYVADPGDVFGALATVIVLCEYLYLAAAAFLTGAQLDALVRERLEGDAGGDGSSNGRAGGRFRPAPAREAAPTGT